MCVLQFLFDVVRDASLILNKAHYKCLSCKHDIFIMLYCRMYSTLMRLILKFLSVGTSILSTILMVGEIEIPHFFRQFEDRLFPFEMELEQRGRILVLIWEGDNESAYRLWLTLT